MIVIGDKYKEDRRREKEAIITRLKLGQADLEVQLVVV